MFVLVLVTVHFTVWVKLLFLWKRQDLKTKKVVFQKNNLNYFVFLVNSLPVIGAQESACFTSREWKIYSFFKRFNWTNKEQCNICFGHN